MNNFKHIFKKITVWFSIPWYFLVFSLYPVLALLATNVGQVKVGSGWRPLVLSVLLSGLLFLLLRWILKDVYRAAFLTTLWMALFFSYGHIYMLLTEKWEEIDFDTYLLVTWLILAILFYIWATRPRFTFRDAVLALNVVSLGLVVTSLVQINSDTQKGNGHYVAAKNAQVEQLTRPQNSPDVYYFILDSYGREDLLKQAYNYDNSGFIQGLEERGFYVADCSQSNYVRTEISLGSSLNMMYLQDLDPAFSPDSTKRARLWDSLKHSATRYNFENMGYKTVGFATGFAWNELEDADIFYSPDSISMGMTEFETLFLRTTLARYVNELHWIDPDQIMGQNFRDRTMNVFNRVDDIARNPNPTFAYIHLISPHPPFVFGPNGEPRYPPDFWNENREYPPDLYAKGYQNQLTFLNKKMLEAVDTILANSDTPPIIVIQGDHGPWLQTNAKRMRILNAYYLPGHNDKVYPTITPVNTFRLIFDTYFGGKYDMLPDISYFSPVPKLYQFSEIPNPCK
jgi:sulfatase-like protein